MQTREETNTSARPCGTRRSPCRSRRRGTQANADVAGFVPSRSAPGARFQCWDTTCRHPDVEQCFCVTVIFDADVSVGSKAEKLDLSIRRPLCSRKRTLGDTTGMSALCRDLTHCSKNHPYSITSSATSLARRKVCRDLAQGSKIHAYSTNFCRVQGVSPA